MLARCVHPAAVQRAGLLLRPFIYCSTQLCPPPPHTHMHPYLSLHCPQPESADPFGPLCVRLCVCMVCIHASMQHASALCLQASLQAAATSFGPRHDIKALSGTGVRVSSFIALNARGASGMGVPHVSPFTAFVVLAARSGVLCRRHPAQSIFVLSASWTPPSTHTCCPRLRLLLARGLWNPWQPAAEASVLVGAHVAAGRGVVLHQRRLRACMHSRCPSHRPAMVVAESCGLGPDCWIGTRLPARTHAA